jgi:PTS system nitrogen regulatory IIA component
MLYSRPRSMRWKKPELDLGYDKRRMTLRNIILANAVFHVGIEAVDKMSALRAIAAHMLKPKGFSRNVIETAALQLYGREQLGSTALGRGLAIPHARISDVKEMLVGWFVPRVPLSFDSLDGELVCCLACILAPENCNRIDEIKTLARISQMMSWTDDFHAIKKAETAEQLYQIISYLDEKTPLR